MSSTQVGCVAVVGGGVIGLSTAFELVDEVRECVVIDPSPGRGATWAAGGMLSPAAEVAPGEDDLLADLRMAASMWPEFAKRLEDESALDIDYVTTGSLLVGLTRSDARDVVRSARQITDAGIEIEALSATEASTLEPSLAAGSRGRGCSPGTTTSTTDCSSRPSSHRSRRRARRSSRTDASRSTPGATRFASCSSIVGSCTRTDVSLPRARRHRPPALQGSDCVTFVRCGA